MPTAVISDTHGNAEALRSVLTDIKDKGCDRIICLGDIIGYGPEPLACIDLVRERCTWALMGNHDFAALYEPTNFNQSAEQSAFWTRAQLDAEPDLDLKKQRYDFLNKLRVRVVEKTPGETHDLLAVHGSPRRPINEYIFPDDALTSPDKLESIFKRVQSLCVVGHTHVPGVFTDENEFYPPSELSGDQTYAFDPEEKAIINVGSVGQPRDLDPRASYAILHEDRVQFVRVEYDKQKTADMIFAIPELNDWLGERLIEGR